jgi:hypothetical protein
MMEEDPPATRMAEDVGSRPTMAEAPSATRMAEEVGIGVQRRRGCATNLIGSEAEAEVHDGAAKDRC